jgi:hypothetical protein
MKPVFKLKTSVVGVLLLSAAMSSSALTLGRARGAAILGQALDLTVSVQFAVDEDISGLCFEADVFYGDVRQESSRVTAAAELTVPGVPPLVRIASRAPVDEPVVTVYLRSACGAKASRRYVLLSDLASEVAPPLFLPAAPAVTASRAPQPAAEPRLAAAAPAPASEGNAPQPKGNARPAPTPTKAPEVLASKLGTSVPKNTTVARARLKLAPLDLSQDWDPALKSSSELMAAPAEDMEKRMAAAALWRSLNLTPEDMLREAARLQGLEQGVQKLSDQTAQNQRQMKELLARLEKADAQKYANPLVYGLAATLLLLVVAFAWGWRKLRSDSTPWWRGDATPQDELSVQETDVSAQSPVSVDPASSFVTAPLVVPVVAKPAPVMAVDIDLHLDEAPSPVAPVSRTSGLGKMEKGASRMMGLRDFSPSMSGSLRSINTQEVLDVRQQADFFMTLGQYDDAIALLEHNIHDHEESNPLVYLDLLKALHTLSRKDAFDRYRNEFNVMFTGVVPPYTQFNQSGGGLEAYPELCTHIASLWPSKAVLEFIEKCLVRESGAAAAIDFELEAFRELLLLHALATQLGDTSRSGSVAFSTAKVSPENASAASEAEPAMAGPVDVDLDLSELSEPEDNLIEFDASGFSVKPPQGKPPA